MIFGLVLGQLTVLKTLDWVVKNTTFEGNFLILFCVIFFFNLKNILLKAEILLSFWSITKRTFGN